MYQCYVLNNFYVVYGVSILLYFIFYKQVLIEYE